MEYISLSKFGDNKQTVQKQTATLALNLVSNFAALYYHHKNSGDYWLKKMLL